MDKYKIVRKSEDCYQVIKVGNKRASKVFQSEKEAIEYAEMNGTIESKPVSNKLIRFFGCLLFLMIGVVLGYFSGDKYFIGIEFELVGADEVVIGLNHKYKENGFIAKYNHKDISSYVEVTYSDEEGILYNNIDSSKEHTYEITYNLKYNKYDLKLNRTVIIDPSIISDDLDIHFMELGNEYTGDSIYIKAGDNDILIDAGSRNSSSKTIINYIDQYCTDNTLEYVIATHAHQDHIAGFVGTSQHEGIFDYYKCEIIIDFPRTEATSKVYQDYAALVQNEVENDGATHYTALECYNNENGAKRDYEIGEGITMSILNNYYYTNDASSENDYSVCLLINDGFNNYLFTGDLEEEGEEKLVELNDLPECKLYKAGHHGSKTSSSEALLSVIKPEIVCVCCCAGSTEYTTDNNNTFPTQAFIDRVSKYTKEIYVTTIVSNNSEGFESMNGNIIVSSVNGFVTVNCSNNNIFLKDTVWFEENRKWPNYGIQ